MAVPYVLVTLVETVGSTPQVLGAKAIVTSSGLSAGTVGGGRIEAKAIIHAQNLLKPESHLENEFVRWNLIKDVGMTCGGVVGLFFEVFKGPLWQVVVFGAGHVAQELVLLLCKLRVHVTCVDDRAEWLDRIPSLPNLTKICVAEPKTVLRDLPDDAFYVCMTQGHKTDLPILFELLSTKNPPYVGAIGSKSKAVVLRRDLRDLGIRDELVEKMFCPVGLPIGDSTPPEIAISIAAQLLQQRETIHPELRRSSVRATGPNIDGPFSS